MLRTFFVLTLALCCASCQKPPADNGQPKQAEALQKVAFAYTFQPQSTLAHVAIAKGYFKDEGLDVTPSLHSFGKMALKTLLDGQADFATVAETPVMFSVLKGDKIAVIANIEASSMNNAVVARADAGIDTPRDLKGKRVGLTPGTTSDFFLDSLLTANGLRRTDIRPVPLKPEEMLDAMMAKQVDAVSTWNYPLTQIKQKLGGGGKIFYDREIYTETFNIVAQQDFIEKNPETAKRFLRALIKAEAFVAKHREEAQSIVATATKTDKTLVSEVWDDFNYHVALDQTLVIALEDETRWAQKNKLAEVSGMPDYRDYIKLDILRAVRSETVKVGW